VLAAIVWGLVQGITEFLPISSDGHLVIVPAFLTQLGFEVATPSLAVIAVLHLGTLIAILVYFREDVMSVLRMRQNPEGRKIALLILIGTIPAALIGLSFRFRIETFQENVTFVGVALIVNGFILVIGQLLARGARQLIDGRIPDAVIVGIAQIFALLPGISRSGTTISAGNGRRFEPTQAARFSFLLGIPAIAGAGLISLPEVIEEGVFGIELLVGFLTAAVSGYFAIALLLRALRRVGLIPFAIYCFVVGILTVAVL
jgi:undecaprenyl-diphosphatase